MKKISILLTSAFVFLSFPAFSAEQKSTSPIKDNYVTKNANTAKYITQDIITVLINLKMFNSYLSALKKAGLIEMFKGANTFTIFAPNDAAFAKLSKSSLENLMKDKAALRRVLLYHALTDSVMSKDMVKKKSVKTLEGSFLKVTQKGKRIIINDSDFLNGDIKTKNGVIHIVDTVIPFIK